MKRVQRLLVAVATVSSALLASSPTLVVAGEALNCKGWPATIVGTEGDDVIDGTDGVDVIVGLGGDDIINGAKGNDIICGNKGKDVIRGNKGGDRIFGGYGDDDLYGGSGNDRIRGQAGDDSIWGGVYSDVCIGEAEVNCEVDYRGERDEELWRDLVDEYFGDIGETDNALTIIACESNGDPFAVNPNGNVPKGLWQYIPASWDWMAPLAGWGDEVRFHPEAATATARRHYDWAANRTRQDGSQGQGFDPWVHCRCLIEEYNCPFDLTALETQ